MVLREQHPLNKGRRALKLTGISGKLYDSNDILQPIVDSMQLMYYKLGWSTPESLSSQTRFEIATSQAPQASSSSSGRQCNGCSNKDPNAFLPTADKSHMSCRVCGAVSSAIRIATDREKNCAKEDDKTTHADRPFDSNTDRFDRPAKSCEELRKDREQQMTGSRISKKAKQKNGLGWSHEHSSRQAAKADRERMEMEPKDATKANHIQQHLDRLFEPLEPMNSQIKRFCRMEADRAWREAVRHSKLCSAHGTCQLHLNQKSPMVIANAVFSNSLSLLLDGHITLDGVTHSGLLVLSDKRMAILSSKGTSSSLRAVETIVATFLSNQETIPLPACQPIKPQRDSPTTAFPKASLLLTPFSRSESSSSDIEGAGELIRIRNHLSRMHKTMAPSVPSGVFDGALKALQSPIFRMAVMTQPLTEIKPLTPSGVAFAILEAISRKMSGTEYLSSLPTKMTNELAAPSDNVEAAVGATVQAAVDVLMNLIPANAIARDDEADYLF